MKYIFVVVVVLWLWLDWQIWNLSVGKILLFSKVGNFVWSADCSQSQTEFFTASSDLWPMQRFTRGGRSARWIRSLALAAFGARCSLRCPRTWRTRAVFAPSSRGYRAVEDCFGGWSTLGELLSWKSCPAPQLGTDFSRTCPNAVLAWLPVRSAPCFPPGGWSGGGEVLAPFEAGSGAACSEGSPPCCPAVRTLPSRRWSSTRRWGSSDSWSRNRFARCCSRHLWGQVGVRLRILLQPSCNNGRATFHFDQIRSGYIERERWELYNLQVENWILKTFADSLNQLTKCLNVGLSPQLVRILRLSVFPFRGKGDCAFRERKVVRTEADLSALFHVVDSPNVLRQICARRVRVVTLVLRDWKTYIRILTMTESGKFDNRTSE